jgi:hypothetical protein
MIRIYSPVTEIIRNHFCGNQKIQILTVTTFSDLGSIPGITFFFSLFTIQNIKNYQKV